MQQSGLLAIIHGVVILVTYQCFTGTILAADTTSSGVASMRCPSRWEPCDTNNDCEFNCCTNFAFSHLKGGCCVPNRVWAEKFSVRGTCFKRQKYTFSQEDGVGQGIPNAQKTCPPTPRKIGNPDQCGKEFGRALSECRSDIDCQRKYGNEKSKCCIFFRGLGCYGGKRCI